MQAWEAFLKRLENDLGKKSVDKWLRSLKVVHFDACNLYLEAADLLHILWFEEHVRKVAVSSFKNNNHHPIKVHLTSVSGDAPQKKQKKGIPSHPPKESSPPFSISSSPLDPYATFENFIISSENTYPLKFLNDLSTRERFAPFNPLYLCGNQSCGKTHLLMALAHRLKERGFRVHFAHTQTFTEHFIAAIRLSQMDAFRTNYRRVDVLILDDIHLLARRNATQEELFHTFNALHSAGKQIVLSSHLSPSQLTEIEPRLISRFEWGLTLHIQPLDLENRSELLQRRTKQAKFPLSAEVINFLVNAFPSTRSLLMASDALLLRAEDKNIPSVDIDQVKILLEDLLKSPSENKLSFDHILSAVASHFDIEKSAILGKAQTKECSIPRQIAMYLCRHELKMSLKTIGKQFSRDHSTVLSSINKIEKNSAAQDTMLCTSLAEVHKSLRKA